MDKPKLLLLVSVSSMAALLINRFRPASATSQAVERLRKSADKGAILGRDQLVELVKFHLYFRELSEVQKAVRELAPILAVGLEEQLDRLAGLLRQDRRRPEAQIKEEAESELDRFLLGLPRRREPAFFHVCSPDPREAMRGAASYKEGVTPEPTDDRGAVYHEDGSRQEQWITKDPITGHVKIVVENYDANDQFTERYVVVTNRQGNLVRDFYVQPDTGSGIERYGYTEPPHGSRSFWRRSGETEWHHGRRPHSLGGDYPTDDAPEENPHYFLKLANGEYAMCYMVNPQAGLSYCTLMNRDQINIDSEMAPVIPATHLKINPRDLVVILDPDGTVVHDEVTLEGIRRRFVSPDPGGRPDPVGGV